MGTTRRLGRRVGRRRRARHLVAQRRRRARRDAVPGEGLDEALRSGRQRHAVALRPRLPHGRVAGRRGEPVPHRGRLLVVGRGRGRGDALLHGAARLDVDRGRQRQARRHHRSRWRRPSAARCTGSSRTSTSPRRRAPRSTRAPCGSTATARGRTTSARPTTTRSAARSRTPTATPCTASTASRASIGCGVEAEQVDGGLPGAQRLEELGAPWLRAPDRRPAPPSSSAFGTTVTPSTSATIQSPSCTDDVADDASGRRPDRRAPSWRRATRSSTRTRGSRAPRARSTSRTPPSMTRPMQPARLGARREHLAPVAALGLDAHARDEHVPGRCFGDRDVDREVVAGRAGDGVRGRADRARPATPALMRGDIGCPPLSPSVAAPSCANAAAYSSITAMTPRTSLDIGAIGGGRGI